MKLFESILSETPLVWQVLTLLATTLACSIIFGVIYCLVKQKDGYFKDMPITLVVFPLIITALTIAISSLLYAFVGSSTEAKYGRVAVALLAAFVMIKFRSQQRTTEDLTYLFFVTAFGLLMGFGYIWFGLIFYAIIVLVVVMMYVLNFPFMSKRNLNLKITIPEDLNYEHAFDGIFDRYTKYHRLTKVKTSDMGTMFVLNYEIKMKPNVSDKKFLDELREKNSNLNIVITVKKFTSID